MEREQQISTSQYQFGARLWRDGHCEWRVWAPKAARAEIVLFDGDRPLPRIQRMTAAADGWYTFEAEHLDVGQRYAFRLNGNSWLPDPASRRQPDGVHQPSALWRPEDFEWTDQGWRGIERKDLVIYELHVGTFTPEGTFAAVIPRLAELRDLGITAVEIMPVGQFPGRRGWGYDGTYWYAVQESYGGPTELQRLIDACHAAGLAAILDVIYNHFGPEGNYLGQYGPFFTDRHQTPWGEGINYDGESSRTVRDFVLANVRQWIRDFHVDGLRLDAVHAIQDDSPVHILAEIEQTAQREAQGRGVPVHVIAESNLNDVKLLAAPDNGGYGLDAVWSDDFHHCVHALLTGERAGYYLDYSDPARQLAKAFREGHVYDGCFSQYRGRAYGTPAGAFAGDRFVVNVQTHDQVGNRARGERLAELVDWPQLRLAAGMMLLSPYLPLLFMGEEYGEQQPFPFFCDFGDEHLKDAVRQGRKEEFASFGWTEELPDPFSQATFESAILSWNWPPGSPQHGLRTLYRELLTLRRTHPALQDVQRRSARLLPSEQQAEILLLERGAAETAAPRLTAAFNLTGRSVTMPADAPLPERLLLDSEGLQFGGSSDARSFDGRLSPFAFALFENSTEVSV